MKEMVSKAMPIFKSSTECLVVVVVFVVVARWNDTPCFHSSDTHAEKTHKSLKSCSVCQLNLTIELSTDNSHSCIPLPQGWKKRTRTSQHYHYQEVDKKERNHFKKVLNYWMIDCFRIQRYLQVFM